MVKVIELQEALRMFKRARMVRREGFRRYAGSPEEICRQIIDDCWEPERDYLKVSNGHFCEFYVRDFAHCAEALVKLGYKKRVDATLHYALETFEIYGRIEQTISPGGKPFSFPAYSPDALALLLHALAVTNNLVLAQKHHALLQRKVTRFANLVVDPQTLLPFRHKRLSGMRDHAQRQAACYDAVMITLVAKYAPFFGLQFPYSFEQIVEQLLKTYWSGSYFYSDATQQPIVVGDANVFPFWTDVLEGIMPTQKLAKMRKQAIESMHGAGLDKPWPLRYVSAKDAGKERAKLHASNWFAGDYQTHSVWMNIGLCYLDVLHKTDPKAAKLHAERIGKLIAKHGTFLELYDRTGKPFQTSFYASDEAMLWCAQWLAHRK